MADDNRPFRFLQLSDVLLDARSSFRELGMIPAKRFERNHEALQSLLSICETASQKQMDAIVINGNLWDAEGVTAATAGTMVDCFSSLGDMPVLILPGMADPLTPQSLFHPKVLAVHGIRPWSRNVHIFSEPGYGEFIHPLRPQVRFYGRGNVGGWTGKTPLCQPRDAGPNVLNVLLDYQPLPVVADDRRLQPFGFIAYGGCNNFSALMAADGRARGIAPGSFLGRSIGERGARSANLVEFDFSTAPPQGRIERILTDKRQIVCVTVSINGVKDVADLVRTAIQAEGARPGLDIVHVTLTGIHQAGHMLDWKEQELAASYFHVRVDNRTRPDYFLDKLDRDTVAGKFIRILQDLKNQAEARGGTLPNDHVQLLSGYEFELSSRQIEDALYFGLEALNQKKVTVADAD
jgi:hypothetical protein